MPMEIDVAGELPPGYTVARVRRELGAALGQLSPGKSGGLFVSGVKAAGEAKILAAAVQQVGDIVKVGVWTRVAKGEKPAVGFAVAVEW